MAQQALHTTTQEINVPGKSSILDRIRWNLSDTLVMTQRNLIYYLRQPQLLVFATIQPIMFLVLFIYVFGGAIAGSQQDYIQYLLPGILVQTVIFGATQTTVGLADDLSKGMIDRFRSLPMGRGAVLAGRTLADAGRGLFSVVIMVAVGTLLGFRFDNGFVNGILAILLAAGFGFAFTWISALIGLLVKNPEAAQVAGFIWVFPLVFASSIFVPTQSMPDWLRVFAENQPISHIADGVRYLFNGDTIPVSGGGNPMGGSMDLSSLDLPPEVMQQIQQAMEAAGQTASASPASAESVLLAVMWIVVVLAIFIPLSVRQYRRTV